MGSNTADIRCPECGKVTKPGRPMQAHLLDAHGWDNRRAHPIANPLDLPAVKRKPFGGVRRGDGDVIDYEDDFAPLPERNY